MQCEFSKSEIYDLNSAVECELAVSLGEGDAAMLKEFIERLNALHVKLAELLARRG